MALPLTYKARAGVLRTPGPSALAKAPVLQAEAGRSALNIPALHAACVIQSDLSGNRGEPT